MVDGADGHEPVTFRDRLPEAFQVRLVTVPPGGCRAYDPAEWRDSLVVVERGQVELECLGGGRRSFGPGDLLCLDGLGLRALHCRGREAAVLAAVSRRRA
jgi:hypothetical protein